METTTTFTLFQEKTLAVLAELAADDTLSDAEVKVLVAALAAEETALQDETPVFDSHAYKITIDWGDEIEVYYRSEAPHPGHAESLGALGATSVTVSGR